MEEFKQADDIVRLAVNGPAKTCRFPDVKSESEGPNLIMESKIIQEPDPNEPKKIKILIVDDSSYNLFVMGELMQ